MHLALDAFDVNRGQVRNRRPPGNWKEFGKTSDQEKRRSWYEKVRYVPGLQPARDALTAVGIGIHDLENLVVLPKPHQGVHTEKYTQTVNVVTTFRFRRAIQEWLEL